MLPAHSDVATLAVNFVRCQSRLSKGTANVAGPRSNTSPSRHDLVSCKVCPDLLDERRIEGLRDRYAVAIRVANHHRLHTIV